LFLSIRYASCDASWYVAICPRIFRYVFPHHQQIRLPALSYAVSRQSIYRQGQLNPGATFSTIKRLFLGSRAVPHCHPTQRAGDWGIRWLCTAWNPCGFIRCKSFPFIRITRLFAIFPNIDGRACSGSSQDLVLRILHAHLQACEARYCIATTHLSTQVQFFAG